ncbi:MAG: hypothetical protein KAI67_05015 [Candidatus Pacebacteria bacterium]|nr:hypothetical protein [Candidatus Paceibacterota bacterium]
MNTKFLALSLVMIGVAGLGLSSASAYKGDPTVKSPIYTPERHEAMTQAFENVDVNAWKEARGDMGNSRMTEVINSDENFAKFIEMRELRLAGDIDGVNAIRADLGLGQGMKGGEKGQGLHKGMRGGSQDGQNSGRR